MSASSAVRLTDVFLIAFKYNSGAQRDKIYQTVLVSSYIHYWRWCFMERVDKKSIILNIPRLIL